VFSKAVRPRYIRCYDNSNSHSIKQETKACIDDYKSDNTFALTSRHESQVKPLRRSINVFLPEKQYIWTHEIIDVFYVCLCVPPLNLLNFIDFYGTLYESYTKKDHIKFGSITFLQFPKLTRRTREFLNTCDNGDLNLYVMKLHYMIIDLGETCKFGDGNIFVLSKVPTGGDK
jgi:hypothetical protein